MFFFSLEEMFAIAFFTLLYTQYALKIMCKHVILCQTYWELQCGSQWSGCSFVLWLGGRSTSWLQTCLFSNQGRSHIQPPLCAKHPCWLWLKEIHSYMSCVIKQSKITKLLQITWEMGNPFPIEFVGYANFNFIQYIQDVKFCQSNAVGQVARQGRNV